MWDCERLLAVELIRTKGTFSRCVAENTYKCATEELTSAAVELLSIAGVGDDCFVMVLSEVM